MGLSTLQENYHANVGVYYTVKRKHHPTKGLWARFDRYYKVKSSVSQVTNISYSFGEKSTGVDVIPEWSVL